MTTKKQFKYEEWLKILQRDAQPMWNYQKDRIVSKEWDLVFETRFDKDK